MTKCDTIKLIIMTTLLLYNALLEHKIYCPVCGLLGDQVNLDDYISDNIMLCCRNCKEILFCPGRNEKQGITCHGLWMGCGIELTHSEAIDYIKNRGWDITDLTEYSVYKIGVLELTHIEDSDYDADGSDVDDTDYDSDGSDVDDTVWREVKAVCFKDIADDIDTSHDGTVLAYKGICQQCKYQYTSEIWGD